MHPQGPRCMLPPTRVCRIAARKPMNMIDRRSPARRHRLSLVLAAALCGSAWAADPLAVRYYEDAVSRFNAGDSKGALIQLKNALQRDPGQLSAKILLGRTHLALGDPRLAEEELLQAQKLGADPLLVMLPLAQARNALGRYDQNIQDIIPIQFPRTQQPDLWTELGLARLYKGDPDGARIAFEEALKIDPAHAGGRLGLARIPLEAKDFTTAGRLATELAASNPQFADAWYVKGAAAHAQGRFDEAAEAYGRAYELDPQHLQGAIGEATAVLEAGKPATAVALLKPLRAKYPANVTIAYLQSEAYKALGRSDEAAAARAAASAIISSYAPTDVAHRPRDLLLFGTIAFEAGQFETAFKFLDPYVETNGADILGRKMLGRTLLGLGKPADALRVLVRLSAAKQADAETLALLGDANIQLGDYAAAERYYRDALQNHNGGAALVRRLGMTQFHSGRRDQALETMQALVENTRGAASTDSALLLGLLYYSENRFAEAGGVADRLVKADPKNHTARNLQGLVAIAQGDARTGRQILESILGEQPDFRPARYNLIKLDIAEGRHTAAESALQSLLARDPKDVRALLEAARFAQAKGDHRVAIAHLEKLREIEPKNILANVELINAYLATGQTPQALTRAAELDRLVPNEFLVKDALARVHIAAGENADAAIALKDVARLAGDDAQRLVYTGRMQSMVGVAEEAAWSFTKALAAQPDNVVARNELATALLRQRKLDEAAVEIDAVLERDPRNPRALALLADLRMRQGRTDDAITVYRRAQAAADTPQVTVSLHRALMTAGREPEALQVLRDWHEAHPDVPLVMSLLADHLQFRGDRDGALALRERLVEIRPQDAAAWTNLAASLSDIDSERALKAAMKAHELAPNDPSVLNTLGWTYTQIGELDKGLAHLREALARDAGNPTIRYHLAVALQEYGNLPGARRELEQALRLSDNFPERDDAAARLNTLQLMR